MWNRPSRSYSREVVEGVLESGVVGVPDRQNAVFPPDILMQALTAPVRDVEGWIGEDVIGLEVLGASL